MRPKERQAKYLKQLQKEVKAIRDFAHGEGHNKLPPPTVASAMQIKAYYKDNYNIIY